MIRSFDYAASAAVKQIAETRPALSSRAAELAESWRQRAIDGFRAAYRKATRGSPVYPANKLQGKALIDFFTLEKAVYEVNYELANRPGWVSIPLTGILRVLAKAGGRPCPPPGAARRDPACPPPQPRSRSDRRCSSRRSLRLSRACIKARPGFSSALLPEAESVAVVESATGRIAARAERIHPAGLFVASMPERREMFRYRLRVRWGGHEQEFEDVYRFGPVLGELDLHLLVEGNHLASYQKLGAHPIVHEGVEGVSFAVWAPNAQRVSLVGDFNNWDGRRMPMRQRHAGGFWEIFVPGLRPGHLYKYELVAPTAGCCR